MTMQSTDEYLHARIHWHRSSIDKNDLLSLMERSDLRGFLQAGLHLGLLFATGSMVYLSCVNHYWLLAGVSLFAHGTFYSFLGWAGAGHELAHRTAFRTRFWNEVFLRLFAFATWNNYVYFCSSHARHHRVTVHDGLDGEVKLPQTFSYPSLIWSFAFDLPAFYRTLRITIENSLNVIRGDWGNTLFAKTDVEARRQVVSWARVVLLGHALLAAIFVTTGHWPLLLVVTFAPFFATWLNKLLAQAQHFGMQPNVSDFRLNSRTVLLNPFLAFLYWQMNYHVEHHMYPRVPFFNLWRLRQRIEPDLPFATNGVSRILSEMAEVTTHKKQNPEYALGPHFPDYPR